MARAEFLALRFGYSRWLKAVEFLVTVLGLLAIVSTPTHWGWKLGCACLLVLFHAGAGHRARSARYSGTLRLFRDSTALVRNRDGHETTAFRGSQAWVSRWVSVVPLFEPDGGMRHYCVICASENGPGEYRRLLQWLRMSASTDEIQKIIC